MTVRIYPLFSVLLLARLAFPAAFPPSIDAVANNYSGYTPKTLPTHNVVAQGAIFIVFGTGLADASSPLQSPPLQTTLNGVSVSITIGENTVAAYLYYISTTQINAVLPSATPLGTGQIIVANNGKASAPAPITVVQSAFGILTLNGAGTGMAAAFDGQAHFLDFTNAVNPGEYVTLWGSGAGAAPDPDGQAPGVTNLSGVPIEVDVGGTPAQVTYHGRSGSPGLDQINFIVPPVPSGCFVSVVVRSGLLVSNLATIPVAASGRTCSDPPSGLSASVFQNLAIKGTATLASIGVYKGSNDVYKGSNDVASAGFVRYTTSQLAAGYRGTSIGSCSVAWSGQTYSTYHSPAILGIPLDAGTLTFDSNAGKLDVSYDSRFGSYYYTSDPGSTGASPVYFLPSNGHLSVTSAGNSTVGKIDMTIDVGEAFIWTNQAAISTIDRTQSLTVTWAGGNPGGWVQISGVSTQDGLNLGSFSCVAPTPVGQFTIPATVLLSLPAGNSEVSSLNVSPVNAVAFTASGLDTGVITAQVWNLKSVQYR